MKANEGVLCIGTNVLHQCNRHVCCTPYTVKFKLHKVYLPSAGFMSFTKHNQETLLASTAVDVFRKPLEAVVRTALKRGKERLSSGPKTTTSPECLMLVKLKDPSVGP